MSNLEEKKVVMLQLNGIFSKSTYIAYIIGCCFCLPACNLGIKKGSDLSESEISYIKGLGLLSDHENIFRFDSQSRFRTSGNFVSNKRVAAYWIGKDNKEKTSVNSAFYKDIDTISLQIVKADTYASYLDIHQINGQQFKVYVNGDSIQVTQFYQQAKAEWEKHVK